MSSYAAINTLQSNQTLGVPTKNSHCYSNLEKKKKDETKSGQASGQLIL